MELELDLEIDRKQIGFLTLGIIFGIGLAAGYTALSNNSQQASNQLVTFLENQSGQDLEVVNSEPAGQYHMVDIRTEDNQVTTYYTDGKRFTSQMQNVEDVQERKTALTEFSQCLQNTGSGTDLPGCIKQPDTSTGSTAGNPAGTGILPEPDRSTGSPDTSAGRTVHRL
jgi:hypothetical protein